MRKDKILFIAEIGLNHNGDFELACKMIEAAANAGANVAKFQSLKAESLLAGDVLDQSFDSFGFSDVKTVRDFFSKVELSNEFHARLNDHCQKVGIEFMSTPFDFESVNVLQSLNVKRIKIASCDLTYYPLLKKAAALGLPMLLSTGGSTLDEIRATVDWLRTLNNAPICLLHCISLYPTPPELANLCAIRELKRITGLEVGFSDHTEGIHMSLAAIALGATVIERHFTIDRSLPGPDQGLSLEPEVFAKMVKEGNEIKAATAQSSKVISDMEERVVPLMRRSIVAARNLKRGHRLRDEDMAYKRPGSGSSPRVWKEFIGKAINRDLNYDEQILYNDLQ